MPPVISKTPFVAEGARIGMGLAKNGANIVPEEGLWVLVVVSEEPSDGVFMPDSVQAQRNTGLGGEPAPQLGQHQIGLCGHPFHQLNLRLASGPPLTPSRMRHTLGTAVAVPLGRTAWEEIERSLHDGRIRHSAFDLMPCKRWIQ